MASRSNADGGRGPALDAGNELTGDAISRADLVATIERAAVGIAHVAPSGRWLFVNRTLCEITGFSREELLRTDFQHITHPADLARDLAFVRRLLAGEIDSYAIDKRYIRRDGSAIWVNITVSLVRAAPTEGERIGPPRYFVAIIEDVSLRKAAEHERDLLLVREREAREACEASQRQVEAASEAKTQFLATMSHELRTPLNAILGYAELLEMGVVGALSESQLQFVWRMRTSGRHLLGLINEVLDLSKVEAGEVVVAREPRRVRDAVEAALELVRPQAATKGIALEWSAPSPAVEYVGDVARVRQILANLCSNAVKFTPPGGRVVVSAGMDGVGPEMERPHATREWAFIRVEDTGIGIPSEERERIFEPFVQVDHGLARSHAGTGLGLAISRRLARLMGGDLTVESEVGRGSTFTLWLPAAPTGSARRDAGSALRDLIVSSLPLLMERFVARLRIDPATPRAAQMAQSAIENHVTAFVTDLAQGFEILDEQGADRLPLIRDGSLLQANIADRHGSQRARLGWTEAALRREFALLHEEMRRLLTERGRGDALAPIEDQVQLVQVFLREAEAIAVKGLVEWRRARDEQ
jgi:PAS domain S-box-containing protein